jgi:hypothetical protein
MNTNRHSKKFPHFIDWLTEKCSETYTTPTLGGRTKVSAVFRNRLLTLSYGVRSKSGLLDEKALLKIFERYHKLGDYKHRTTQYTDTEWKETLNRILAPYAAALIRDFESGK